MRKKSGIALVATLFIMVIIAILVFGSFFTTQVELWAARNDTTSTMAHYVAQAGLQRYKAALFQNYRWLEEQIDDSNPDRTICLNRLERGISWGRNATFTNFVNNRITLPTEDVRDAAGNVIGTYDVTIYRDPSTTFQYTLESIGRSAGARSTVRATYQISNSGGATDQGVFLGDGAANRFINGGSTIRSSIYIVGKQSQPNAFVFVSNGDMSQLNHYNINDYGIGVANKVTSANRSTNNLCATLRVQYGKVQVGGSTQLGEPNNQLLGVFVSTGAGDVTTQGNMDCTNNKGICTDDLGPFDLHAASAPHFPTFDGAAPEGNLLGCAAGTPWRNCIAAEALRPGGGLRVVRGETPSIKWPPSVDAYGNPLPYEQIPQPATPPASCVDAFNLAAASADFRLTLNTTDVDCSYRLGDTGPRGGFKYVGSTATARLEVYGTVSLKGYSVTFSKNTEYHVRTNEYNHTTNTFTGTVLNNGSFVAEKLTTGDTTGRLDINGTFLPTGTDDANRFPNHVLAPIAEGSIYQRGAYVMAPLYSGSIFRTIKDNVLIGSVMANELCTTSAGNETLCNAGQKSEYCTH